MLYHIVLYHAIILYSDVLYHASSISESQVGRAGGGVVCVSQGCITEVGDLHGQLQDLRPALLSV